MADKFKSDDSGKNKLAKKVLATLSLKFFIPIICVVIAIIIFFGPIFIVIGTVLEWFDLFDSNSNNGEYIVYQQNNDKYWWPIGSYETTEENGVLFAGGVPAAITITSPFGYRCIGNSCGKHYGIDISGYAGDERPNIIAAKDGTVFKVNNECPNNGSYNDMCGGGGAGNYIVIEHSDGSYTKYFHLTKDSLTVSVGDNVEQGQVIAKMGTSGSSTGVHLHFQIDAGGYAVDPMTYLSHDDYRPTSKKTDIVGDDNLQTICLNLKQNGYSDTATAAILGNMKAESGFLPVNTNYLGCDGIVQWCFGRLTNLKSTYGNDWTDINNQVAYVIYELENSYIYVNNYLKDDYTVEEKAYYFCMRYEVPGESVCSSGVRQKYAEELFSYVKNGCK